MEGFGLLIGHLVGDYLLQNDYLAANKTNPSPPGLDAEARRLMHDRDGGINRGYSQEVHDRLNAWEAAFNIWCCGHIACTIHCLLYTFAVWLCSFWWMPYWGLVACYVIHWPIDRFRLARLWMEKVSGQKAFATGALAPWSVIVVDNTFHLLTLFAIGLLARGF